MTRKLEKGLFVVGTGTEVGKTYVTCLIARSLHQAGVQVGVYKPVASGCRRSGDDLISSDARQLWDAAGRPQTLDAVTPQRFAAPLAPNVAARQEGRAVDSELLRSGIQLWAESDFLLVEGVGGLLSPISDELLVIDLAADFGLPVLVVVANRLGCINETLLTLAVLQGHALPVAGMVLNDVAASLDDSAASNRSEIERLTQIPVWDRVGFRSSEMDLSRCRCLPE